MSRRHRATGVMLSVLAALLLSGCHSDMWVQPKVHKPNQPSDFFVDGNASRQPPAGTVARGNAMLDEAYYTGIRSGSRTRIEISSGQPVDTGIFRGQYVDRLPFRMRKPDFERGRDLFTAFCSPCHGQLGYGDGMITRRGLVLRRRPANYHTDRLRRMPVGHFYDVITNGYGIMFSYAARVQDPADRWRIVAYIRALQASQNATRGDVPPGAALEEGGAGQAAGTENRPQPQTPPGAETQH